jgi:hypothetical protein
LKTLCRCGKKHRLGSETITAVNMKAKRFLRRFLVVPVLWLGVAGIEAQTNPVTAVQPTLSGQVVVPERLTAVDANVGSTANLRPARSERSKLPPEVLARIDRFTVDARAYLAQQEALKKRLQGANEEQRAAIRQQIEALRDRWLEINREMRRELKDRLQELSKAGKLDAYGKLLDTMRENAQQQIRDTKQEHRKVVDP